ncbi:type II toxin-antitoxin system RelE/ParE family toxin [Candidatus Poribacteria bacterium]|nr:type II toxin-antitoxin system RelE/ParE family toxin [Candidatus Poribacteria bacterium]
MRKSDNVSAIGRRREWEVIISPTALRRLERLPPAIVQDVLDKIEWLRSEADSIRHARLTGSNEFSLHAGQYRIPYTLDRSRRRIEILDVGKHDEAYRRVRARR